VRSTDSLADLEPATDGAVERAGSRRRARLAINDAGLLNGERSSGRGESTGPTHDRGNQRDV
jgi:hypothetical protein